MVSDTTTFWFKKKAYDWTYYLDVFNNEIVDSDVRETMHGTLPKKRPKNINFMIFYIKM